MEMRSHRKQRVWLLAGVVVVAIVLAGVAVLIGSAGNGGKEASAGETAGLFAGIPQQGMALGNPDAPVTLEEFADLQCPFCRDYAVGALPQIVKQYVRTGKVRLVYRPLAILGPDSVAAARVANAAASQNKMWDFVDRFYQQQGEENTGYVTDSFLRKVGSEVNGLDVNRALSEAQAQNTLQTLAASTARAKSFGVDSTPSFAIGRTGQKAHLIEVTSLAPSFFSSAIQHELGQ
ncbi:MAG TPA: thioredoxin domain-containing protein [Candidatus Dormibacteraeota bacterium]|nr:thioredoxin domain-containing protein [Candidatus Dormibacteraeota bacterium]